MAGNNSEKKLAASMIPAAMLSRLSSSFCDRERTANTPTAPTVVPRLAKKLPAKPRNEWTNWMLFEQASSTGFSTKFKKGSGRHPILFLF